jgi:NADPH2:quinone reductase
MSLAIVISEPGGPEVLRPVERDVGAPETGQIKLLQTAIAVNFHDIYVRTGSYKTLTMPGIPGLEGVGIVDAVGAGVTGFAPGDHVAYMTHGYGGYAAERNLDAGLAVKIPNSVPDEVAAAAYLKGLTVEMLARRAHRLQAGETVLIHAAAGGVGRLLVQWAVHLGATVIGTAGSEAKRQSAREAGCALAVDYRSGDWVASVKDFTGGRGVDVVYDAVGRDTIRGSMDALALCGHLVNFGQASGPVDAIAPVELFVKSLTLSRPNVFHYVQQQRTTLEEAAANVFQGVKDGWLSVPPPTLIPLADAAEAHRLLESRTVVGAIVLRP